jgi:hypothetical protein
VQACTISPQYNTDTTQHKYNTTITYNVYESYHSHNSCDAAAAHAKNRINTQQRNTNIPITTTINLVTSINTLKNSHAQLASIMPRMTIKVSAIDKIKSLYKYKFPRQGVVDAYSDSMVLAPFKRYNIKETAFPYLTESMDNKEQCHGVM